VLANYYNYCFDEAKSLRSLRATKRLPACARAQGCLPPERATPQAVAHRFGVPLLHSQFSGNNIVADDHRLEVCGFAMFRLFRNRFLSGVTRASTISPVTMYVP
jgi:hypothetical protein